MPRCRAPAGASWRAGNVAAAGWEAYYEGIEARCDDLARCERARHPKGRGRGPQGGRRVAPPAGSPRLRPARGAPVVSDGRHRRLRSPRRARRPAPVPRRDGRTRGDAAPALPALRLQPGGRARAVGHAGADDSADAPAMVARRAGRDHRRRSYPPPRGRHPARSRARCPARRATSTDVVAAREADLETDAPPDIAAILAYLDATAGTLLWTAARLSAAADEAHARDAGLAQGAAGLLNAVPDLVARGRHPLPHGDPHDHAAALAKAGRAALDRFRRATTPAAARPAFLVLPEAAATLRRIARDPGAVLDPPPQAPSMRTRLALAFRAVANRP